jgi:hypothetical protein
MHSLTHTLTKTMKNITITKHILLVILVSLTDSHANWIQNNLLAIKILKRSMHSVRVLISKSREIISITQHLLSWSPHHKKKKRNTLS